MSAQPVSRKHIRKVSQRSSSAKTSRRMVEVKPGNEYSTTERRAPSGSIEPVDHALEKLIVEEGGPLH